LPAIAAIPVLDRLLVLCMPPLDWRGLQVSVLWGLPLFAAALVFGWVLRPPSSASPPSPTGGTRILALASRRSLAVDIVVPVLALGLGVVGALLSRDADETVDLSPLPVIVALVLASCAQEWLYRRVVQPVAVAIAGSMVGLLATSALAAFTWVAALAVIVPMGVALVVAVVAAALLFGLATLRGRLGLGAVLGRGLFTLAVALLVPLA
jgi:hypothetical protein